ncbi:glutathione S-transferase [Bordetella trematum]|uniref:Glutathione S-transferase n=1 Tax=Bordetella trematum TaxID=123899 RepID=A0A157NV20_9BORD|nr:glutathione transferase [Bordetella trematum]AUL46386.1 glutathione S-transferase [Bordetella trematum]NNH21090.1 glutathione transferase [Bordetella trematum]SAI24619.1 glutathione S-transferase [Bordetella trematum]SAI26848.1 glutathione S-transferase [Bordetella trematum]SAI70377.1 glutathione S-transferase [Bordetella trematum]
MTAPLTLYVDANFLSPYAMSVHVALSEKGLPFEVRLVDLAAREQMMVPFQQRALTCRVPALTHDDFPLTESSAIAEYLEESFPPPQYAALYPAEPRLRARTRQLQAWLRSDLGALRKERSTEHVFHEASQAPLGPQAQVDAAKLLHVAQLVLKPGQTQLFGQWCLADTELALMLKRLSPGQQELPAWLHDYASRQWERPSVQQWVEHNQAARA